MRQLTTHKCRVYHARKMKWGSTPLGDVLQQIEGPADISPVFGRIRFPIGESERLTRLFAQLKSHTAILDLRDFLIHLSEWTCLFDTTEDASRDRYMKACRALVQHHKDAWMRPVPEFRPKPGKPMQHFSALTRHLFSVKQARIPCFFDGVWFSDDQDKQKKFIDLGSGTDVRRLGLPFSVLTKKMVHEFLTADPSIVSTPEGAIRFAEINVLGRHRERHLNTAFLEAVLQTRLATDFEDSQFWRNVFRFLMDVEPQIVPERVPEIIDYIYSRRYGPEPDFSINGRTAASLLRRVEAWHRELHQERTWAYRTWGRVPGMSDTCIQVGRQRYFFRQLLSTQELSTEGSALNHCVVSYSEDCFHSRSSIWSMQEEKRGNRSRILTIEVSLPDRIIRQVKGYANRDATPAERSAIREWAAAERLHMPR